MTRRLLLLLGGTLACWVLVSLPARALLEDAESVSCVIGYSGAALLLCLVPSTATLLWASAAMERSPETQLAAVMGGTGVRLFTVLLAGWMLHQWVPFFQDSSFWTWLLVAYLYTLALEMTLLLVGRTAAAPKP